MTHQFLHCAFLQVADNDASILITEGKDSLVFINGSNGLPDSFPQLQGCPVWIQPEEPALAVTQYYLLAALGEGGDGMRMFILQRRTSVGKGNLEYLPTLASDYPSV